MSISPFIKVEAWDIREEGIRIASFQEYKIPWGFLSA
jgi:hypothetical protein